MNTSLRNAPLFAGALMSIGITLASSSSRADCLLPSYPDVSEDTMIMDAWDCSAGLRNQFWNDFRMAQGWNGFGADDPCNIRLPLARTFNSLALLHGTSLITDPVAFGRLYNAYNLVAADVGALTAVCDGGPCYGATFFPGEPYHYVHVSRTFFYDNGVVERTALLVHEARHRQKSHDAGSNCPRHGACDSSWAYDGANTREVQWLSDYLDMNPWTADMRISIYIDINYILAYGYQSAPNLKKYAVSEVYTPGLVELCYPNCTPPPPPDPPCGDLGLCGVPGRCYTCGSSGEGCEQAMPQIADAYPEDVAEMGDRLITCP